MNPRSKTTQSILMFFSIVAIVVIGIFTCLSLFKASESAVSKLTVEWPQPAVNLIERQTFKVAVESPFPADTLDVSWSVDNGTLVESMQFDGTSFTSDVDTSNWDWRRDNTYQVDFMVASRAGMTVATATVTVTTGIAGDVISVSDDVYENKLTVNQQASSIGAELSKNTTSADVTPKKFSVEWVPGPVRNNQQFILHTEDYTPNELTAFWSAEGGHKNIIYKDQSAKNFTTNINVFGWLWKGAGPYPITFTITDKVSSAVVATETLDLYWKGKPGESEIEFRSRGVDVKPKPQPQSQPKPTTPIIAANPKPIKPTSTPNPVKPATPIVKPPSVATPPSVSNLTQLPANTVTAASILGKTTLYTPAKPAVANALAKLSNIKQKEALNFIQSQPSSVWLNGDAYETDAYITGIISAANTKNAVPVFVLYNIVQRDCNGHSSGGVKTMDAYKAWINRLSGVFKNQTAMIVVEPDALAMLNCVSGTARSERLEMIKYAVTTLTKASPKLLVYIDAGHPFWVNAEEMSARLLSAGVGSARGFSINVSSYASMEDNMTYGTYLSNLLGGKRFVVDSSRNGNGHSPNREWCNPSGRALGQSGTLHANTKGSLDATLWIKYPGESDGTCNGGPGAGAWWTEYATALYTNRK